MIMCEVCKVKRHAWYNLVWVSLILWLWPCWLWLRLLCWNCQSILGNLRAGGERGENNCPAATRTQSSPCPQWTMSTSSDQKHPVSLSVPSHRLRFDPSSNIWDHVMDGAHHASFEWPLIFYISCYQIHTYTFVNKVWHTSVLNKLDQVVATSYSRNHAEVCVVCHSNDMMTLTPVFRWLCCSRRTSTSTSWGGKPTRRGSMCRRQYRTWW